MRKTLNRPSVLPRPLLKSRLLSLNSYTCLEIRFNQDTTSLCRHVTWGRRSMPTSEVVIFMVMPCMGSSTRVCNSAFNCVFDVSAHVCSFCSSYQTSQWCPMETADNLPANVTGNCIIHHEYYHIMYTCTHYVTPAIKIPLQHKRHFRMKEDCTLPSGIWGDG